MSEGGSQRRSNGPAAAGRSPQAQPSAGSVAESRSALAARLRERLPEIQAAIANRVYAIADPHAVTDSAYPQGLDAAVAAAIDHRLAGLEGSERHPPAIPPVLLAQARLDARDGVSLDTVLRRYFAGNALFGDFLVEEAERAEVPSGIMRRFLAAQSTLLDRLLVAVSAEHAREAAHRPSSAAERRRECVKSLLAGELVDSSELGYDIDGHHLALMAKGEGAEELMRRLAKTLDRRLLAIPREEEPIWACWLGGRRGLASAEVSRALTEIVPDGVFVTVGEPGEGLLGWRSSHRQAKATLPLAERWDRAVLRYADDALLASIYRDDLIVRSFYEIYIVPLERSRDGGKVAKETLRAYFAAERNISSTAAALGVDRRTVTNRIGAIEALIDRRIKDCSLDLQLALRLDE